MVEAAKASARRRIAGGGRAQTLLVPRRACCALRALRAKRALLPPTIDQPPLLAPQPTPTSTKIQHTAPPARGAAAAPAPARAARAAAAPATPARASTAAAAAASRLAGVEMAPPDPILGVSEAFRASTNASKLNLGVGAYRTEELQPLVLDCVKKVRLRAVEAVTHA